MAEPLSDRVIALVRSHAFRCVNEAQLQEALATVVAGDGLQLRREARLATGDRLDLLVGDGLAVEVKMKGGLSEVTRQLMRYAEQPEVLELLLVTTRAGHLALPPTMRNKPLRVVLLQGGLM